MAKRTNAPIDPFDPTNMTSEARVAEIASILASGLLRLRARGTLDPVSLPQDSAPSRVDVSQKTRLHGRRG